MPTGYAFQKTRNYPSDLISLIGDVPAGLCTPQPGFTMIVSDERSWCSDLREEENRVTVEKFVVNNTIILRLILVQM